MEPLVGSELSSSGSDSAVALADVFRDIPRDVIASIVDVLRSTTSVIGRPELELRVGVPPPMVEKMLAVLRHWQQFESGYVLLADALEAYMTVVLSYEQLGSELVWTGPNAGGPAARRTSQVVAEMLGSAASHVMVVGYSLFLAGAEATRVLERLGELSQSGVQVEFVVDRRYAGWDGVGGEGFSVRQIHEHWPENCKRPVVWSFTSDEGSAKLHAKVLIVDRRDLLVTSANLTGAGLGENLELGVRQSGRTAQICAEHFTRLMSAGFFDVEPWPQSAVG